jgi:SHS2 domain-containing protein
MLRLRFFFNDYAWTVGQVIELYLYKNGAFHSILDINKVEYTGTSQRYLSGSDMVYLDVDDYVEIYFSHDRGSDTNIYTDTIYNYFSVHRIN